MSDRRARVHGFRGYKCNNYRWHVFLSTKGRRNGILAFDTWDIGDPEPEDVDAVEDYTAPDFDPADSFHESPRWGRTYKGDWEGCKNGKVYTDWDDLVRRWGPLTEES